MSKSNNLQISILLVFLIAFLFNLRQTDLELYSPLMTRVLGFAIIAYAFFTGILALAVGVVASILTFFLSLPFIAPVYAFLIGYGSLIYKRVIVWAFSKILKLLPPVRRALNKIEASATYKRARKRIYGFMAALGLRQTPVLKLYEMRTCKTCGKKTPAKGMYCMNCGSKRRKK